LSTPEEIIEQIRQLVPTFDDVKIYYTLRKMGAKFIRKETIDVIKILLACNSIGLRYVTPHMLHCIRRKDKDYYSIYSYLPEHSMLHTLGDKKIVNLNYLHFKKRRGKIGTVSSYSISKQFLDNFKRIKKGLE